VKNELPPKATKGEKRTGVPGSKPKRSRAYQTHKMAFIVRSAKTGDVANSTKKKKR